VALGKENFQRENSLVEDSEKDIQVHNVNNIYIHPDYERRPTVLNDIAILETKRNIVLTSSIKAICLPQSDSNRYINDVGVALGNTNKNETNKHETNKNE
jgi:hypothetical protein